MVTGITLLKADLASRLKHTVKCLAMAGVFQPVLVDTAEATRCKVAMVALQALVDILTTVKPATTAATRVDAMTNSKMTFQLCGPCGVLFFFEVASRTLYTTTLLAIIGVLECTSSGLEYIGSSSHGLHVHSLLL